MKNKQFQKRNKDINERKICFLVNDCDFINCWNSNIKRIVVKGIWYNETMKYLNWIDIDIHELNDKIKRKYGRVDKRNENYLKDSKCLIEIITILRILLNIL